MLCSCSLEQTPHSKNILPQNSTISQSSPPTAFIAIHLEPGVDPRTTIYQDKYWSSLVDLVALADTYNLKLTLEFTPQWASYVLADSSKLTLVRSWEAEGHEIAVHHHGPHYASTWDGYTNQVDYVSDPDYIGSISDMMALINQLPSSGQVLTGGISDDNDRSPDWPDGVIYSSEGGINGVDDLLGVPTSEDYGGHSVTQLSYAQYTTGALAVSLEDVQYALHTAQDGQVLGIVFHEFNYAEHPDDIEALFKLFQKDHISEKTVSEILG